MLTNYVRVNALCSSMFSFPGKKLHVRRQQKQPTVILLMRSDLEFILH